MYNKMVNIIRKNLFFPFLGLYLNTSWVNSIVRIKLIGVINIIVFAQKSPNWNRLCNIISSVLFGVWANQDPHL